ncbi:hypothetical protein [Propionispira raffinosivorans]|uniref:hypothetical protein n=1 Tax=Propionispira raffinosivorans TaxID=86959 RepID=UPI000376BA00|nr:hypothetical protein [Propionispira raffinosivorans]
MSGDADSTTKSAISNGTITVTGNQKQDLSKLNRDPSGVLNALGKIFDKKTVQEKQELTNLFAQEAYKAIGDLALQKQNEAISKAKAAEEAAKKGDLKKATQLYEEAKNIASNWQDGGASKIALHAVVGGLIGQISGGNAASEAFSAGTNEASYNSKLIQNLSPELKEFTSIVIGAGVAKLTGGNSKSGASVALSGTKNNNILHDIGWDTLGNLLDETEEVIKEKREANSQANSEYMKINTEGDTSSVSEETYGDNIPEKQIENAQEIKEDIKRAVSTSDDTAKNEVSSPHPTPDSILGEGGYWNNEGKLVSNDGQTFDYLPNRGDYEYSRTGRIDDYYPDGTAAIVIDGNSYPIYNAPSATESFNAGRAKALNPLTAVESHDNWNSAIKNGYDYQSGRIWALSPASVFSSRQDIDNHSDAFVQGFNEQNHGMYSLLPPKYVVPILQGAMQGIMDGYSGPTGPSLAPVGVSSSYTITSLPIVGTNPNPKIYFSQSENNNQTSQQNSKGEDTEGAGEVASVEDILKGANESTVRDADGNIRMRIDPPDKVTNYDHVHLYDENGKPLDVNLNIIDRKNPDAHIPIAK